MRRLYWFPYTSGKVHISYLDFPNGDLKYATNAVTPNNKPTVITRKATKVTSNSATLKGKVNAHGLSTEAWFEYGTTSGSYTNKTPRKTIRGKNTSR